MQQTRRCDALKAAHAAEPGQYRSCWPHGSGASGTERSTRKSATLCCSTPTGTARHMVLKQDSPHFEQLLCLQLGSQPVFAKHRDMLFFPTAAYAWTVTLLRIPYSLGVVVPWCTLTYFSVGLTVSPGRCDSCRGRNLSNFF